MPRDVPPFPDNDPHRDQQFRELYSRTATVQRILGVEADGGDEAGGGEEPTPVIIDIIDAIPIKLTYAYVSYNHGWGPPSLFSGPKTFSDMLVGQSIVHDIFASVDTAFNHEDLDWGEGVDPPRLRFYVGVTSTAPPLDHLDQFARSHGQAGVSEEFKHAKGPIQLDFVGTGQPADPGYEYYQNVGHRRSIGWLRAGFWASDQGSLPNAWPSGLQGKLFVTILYSDSTLLTRKVPLQEIEQYTLLAPTPPVA